MPKRRRAIAKTGIAKKFKHQPLIDNKLGHHLLSLHQAYLPQNLSLETTYSLIVKIHTAILTTKRMAVLGSGNKQADCERTEGFSIIAALQRESSGFGYQKNANQQWIIKPPLTPLNIPLPFPLTIDPLGARFFFEEPFLKRMIQVTSILQRERVASCGDRAVYLAHYLWENPGKEIYRIEVAHANEFDHGWVMINRKGEHNHYEDGWLLDPWWGDDGIFYHLSEFKPRMLAVLAYIIQQKTYLATQISGAFSNESIEKDKMILKNYEAAQASDCLSIPITSDIDFNPQILRYHYEKKYKKNFSDYYEHSPYQLTAQYQYRQRAFSEKQAHQAKFSACVDEINRLRK